ncbi:MAG: DUF72 domain-containing protein [Planctomycetota bacterium]
MAGIQSQPVSIGCPVWSCPGWRGSVYPQKAAKSSWLKYYSQTFNSVEGNSSFYGIPTPDTFKRWADETADGFEFCFKFPRVVSHDCKLVGAARETDQFLEGIRILHERNRLGVTFLQLGPDFSPKYFFALKSFLASLPEDCSFAVEVRHPDWFSAPVEQEFNELLSEREMDRVLFDSRALHSAPAMDEYEERSQVRKPNPPLRQMATANRPMLRFIGRNKVELTQPWIDEWIPVLATWIGEGRRPYVFAHTPDDTFAPQFARRIHNALAQQVEAMATLEEWPFHEEKQMELF